MEILIYLGIGTMISAGIIGAFFIGGPGGNGGTFG